VDVQAGAHPLHGSQIAATVAGIPGTQSESLAERTQERLGPLTMRHEVQWR